MNELYDNVDRSISQNAWWSLPEFVEWLRSQRKNQKAHSYTMNLTIILHTTCIIEGFLFELISTACDTPLYNMDLNDRLLIDFNARLENATWSQYQEFHKICFNKKLSEETTPSNWKAISMLFTLRNLLTHGKTIELKFYSHSQNEPVLSGKYSTVYSYFKEVKLIDITSKKFAPAGVDFVTTESADFFYKQCKYFLKQIYNKVVKKSHFSDLVGESFREAFKRR